MAVMTEPNAGPARETRWSANKKTDAVLRLLRGEKLDALSRERADVSQAKPATEATRATRSRTPQAGETVREAVKQLQREGLYR